MYLLTVLPLLSLLSWGESKPTSLLYPIIIMAFRLSLHIHSRFFLIVPLQYLNLSCFGPTTFPHHLFSVPLIDQILKHSMFLLAEELGMFFYSILGNILPSASQTGCPFLRGTFWSLRTSSSLPIKHFHDSQKSSCDPFMKTVVPILPCKCHSTGYWLPWKVLSRDPSITQELLLASSGQDGPEAQGFILSRVRSLWMCCMRKWLAGQGSLTIWHGTRAGEKRCER